MKRASYLVLCPLGVLLPVLMTGCAGETSGGETTEPVPPSVGSSAGGARSPFGISPPVVGALARPTVSAAKSPPPLSGGTLAVLADGTTAVAADPDRDKVFFVDLKAEKLLATVALNEGDEPGRLIEDATGRVHVALRRGGAIATLARAGDGWVTEARRPICPAPRGLAYDKKQDLVWAACAGGELVAFPAIGNAPARTYQLERDLRDVVIGTDRLFISRFRSAEVLIVTPADGMVHGRQAAVGSRAARQIHMGVGPNAEPMPLAAPAVAWRMIPHPAGGAVMIHQESSNAELGTSAGGYAAGPCKGGVAAALARFREGQPAGSSPSIMQVSLPIDVALSRDGKVVAVVAAGQANSPSRTPQIVVMPFMETDNNGCTGGGLMVPTGPGEEPIEARPPGGEAIAVAFDGLGRLVVQTREPARVEVLSHRGGSVLLSDESRADTGHAVFHASTSFGLACASCHPEGGDDGRVWRFSGIGARRTQNLRGGIVNTAPFHWDGDMRDMSHLMSEVFGKRMSGPALPADKVDALANWVDRIPALPALATGDAGAIARGKALFNNEKVGCATCHGGPALTNNTSVDVGTGNAFQVPSLKGIGWRAPYMHNGCATRMADRFSSACGGGDKHGVTSHLTKADLADLTAYLDTL